MNRAADVRVATAADAAFLLPLFKAFYGAYLEPPTVEAIARHIAAASIIDTVILASAEGRAVGFASLRVLPQVESDAPHAELSDLYVDPPSRRRGIGTALVRFAEELARHQGAPKIHLVTGLDNDGARTFYRASGYEEFALAMRRRLEGER